MIFLEMGSSSRLEETMIPAMCSCLLWQMAKNTCRQELKTRSLHLNYSVKSTLSRIFTLSGTGTASLAKKKIIASIGHRLGSVSHWHSLVRNFFCKSRLIFSLKVWLFWQPWSISEVGSDLKINSDILCTAKTLEALNMPTSFPGSFPFPWLRGYLYVWPDYWPCVRSRWLDIGQVLFLRAYGPRPWRSWGP